VYANCMTVPSKCPYCGEERSRFVHFIACGHLNCDQCYEDFDIDVNQTALSATTENESQQRPLFQCYDCDAPVMQTVCGGIEPPICGPPASVSAQHRLGALFKTPRHSRRLCVVVHCRIGETSHAVEQATIAFDNGADGVFLAIHRKHSPPDLLLIYYAVRSAHPEGFIGLNFLSNRVDTAIEQVPLDCQALWTDDGIDGKQAQDGVDAQIPKALGIRFARKWRVLLFAGFAFKYRQAIPDEELIGRGALARRLFDVPTTSGPGTGQAISLQRAAAIRAAVGNDAVLAVASGVSSENAVDLLPFFDVFLVATGLEAGAKYSGVLMPQEVRRLADIVHSFEPPEGS